MGGSSSKENSQQDQAQNKKNDKKKNAKQTIQAKQSGRKKKQQQQQQQQQQQIEQQDQPMFPQQVISSGRSKHTKNSPSKNSQYLIPSSSNRNQIHQRNSKNNSKVPSSLSLQRGGAEEKRRNSKPNSKLRLQSQSSPNQLQKLLIGSNTHLESMGECLLTVQLIQIRMNHVDVQLFTKLQERRSQHYAAFEWEFQSDKNKWKFMLTEDQGQTMKFVLNKQGQLISGHQKKWQVVSPIAKKGNQNAKNKNNKSKLGAEEYFCQSITNEDYERQQQQESKKHITMASMKTIDHMNERKAILFKLWGQQLQERIVSFKPPAVSAKRRNLSELKNYKELNKFFRSMNNEWELSTYIDLTDSVFRAWIVSKHIEQDDPEFESRMTFLEKQIQKVEASRKLYISKMYKVLKEKTKQNKI